MADSDLRPVVTRTLYRDSRRTSERLRGVLTLLNTNPNATLGEVQLVMGRHILLLPLFLLALVALPLALIPFTTPVLGAAMLWLALPLALGQEALWLPGRWLAKPAPGAKLEIVIGHTVGLIGMSERFTRPRYPQFSEAPLHYLSGFLLVALSLAIALPIPFGNIAPTLAILLLALGHLEEDGLFVAFGQIIGLLTLGGLLVITTLIVGAFGASNLLTGG